MASIPALKRLTFLTISSFIGFGISLFQTHHFFSLRNGQAGFSNLCSFGSFDCNAVELSSYAELFSGFPLSALAAAWFVVIAILSVMAREPIARKDYTRILFPMTIISLIASAFYLCVMFFVIQKHCLFCYFVDLTSLISFGIVASMKPFGDEQKSKKNPYLKKTATLVGGSVFALFILSSMMNAGSISDDVIKREVKSLLSKKRVVASLNGGHPTLGGGPDAPIQIVKFSDFKCPACKLGAYSLHPVFSKYGNQVRLTFKNFPLDPRCNRLVKQNIHPSACEAAKVAYCAGKQGKFEAVYQEFFENQEAFGKTRPTDMAIALGVNAEELKACVESSETQQLINRDVDEGESLEVESTPNFVINGIRVKGYLPADAWMQLVEKLLEKKE